MQPARDAETSFAERTALLETLKRENLSGFHLEIGTAAGGTLRDMMLVYPAETRPQFVVVDPLQYFPNQKQTITSNLAVAGLDPNAVQFRVGNSWPLCKKALANSDRFSFIFIDAVHDAEHVMQDLTWARMLEPGGLVAFHDYNAETFPGVTWSVDYFLRKWPNYQICARAESILIAKKIAPSTRPEISTIDLIAAAAVSVFLRWRRSFQRRTDLLTGHPGRRNRSVNRRTVQNSDRTY